MAKQKQITNYMWAVILLGGVTTLAAASKDAVGEPWSTIPRADNYHSRD